MARVYCSRPESDRFWEKVDKRQDGCWCWTASCLRGYGRFRVYRDGRHTNIYAHRFAYEELVGPIPEGLQLDHLCRNPSCVNPAHLEAVTCRVNLLRGVGPTALRAAQTHCKRGHSLHDAYITKRGNRECRVCRCESELRKYHARRRLS